MSGPASKASEFRSPSLARSYVPPSRVPSANSPTRERRVLELQRQAGNHAASSLLGQNGRRLPESLRAEMESRFAIDLGDVRIHDDGHAQELAAACHAKAFTHGNHI